MGRGHASLLSNSDPALIAVRPQARKGASVFVPNSAAEQTAPPTSSLFGSLLKTPRSVLAPAHHSGAGTRQCDGLYRPSSAPPTQSASAQPWDPGAFGTKRIAEPIRLHAQTEKRLDRGFRLKTCSVAVLECAGKQAALLLPVRPEQAERRDPPLPSSSGEVESTAALLQSFCSEN